LKLYSVNASPKENYIGPAALMFFHEAAASAPGQVPSRKLVAVADLAGNAGEVFIVLFPKNKDGDDGAKYEAMVFNLSPENFPRGKALILNASGMEFAGKFNDAIMEVKQGVVGMVDARGALEVDIRRLVKVSGVAGTREEWISAYSNRLAMKDDRMVLLFLPPLYKNSMEVRVRYFTFADSKPDVASGRRALRQN
jgi:hypothetical protein